MGMENIFLLIALTYAISLSIGTLMEKKLRIPWMFAALFFGIIISTANIFKPVIESESFHLFANLGMLILLFLIGFNLRLEKIKKLGKYIFFGSFFILGLEALFGTMLLYFVFSSDVSNSLLIAFITALSFATVGEVVLLPILAEFKILNTKFGQLTLGIGTLDDIVEILMLVIVSSLVILNVESSAVPSPAIILGTLVAILILTIFILSLKTKIKSWLKKETKYNYVHYLLVLVIFFSFIALSQFAFESLAPIAAILSGIVARELFPKNILYENEKSINFLGYVFLSPLFFLGIGSKVSIPILFVSPFIVIAIWIVSKGSKLLASFILFRKILGTGYSLLLGLGLSVRFSTSLIVQFILLESGLISTKLFSALIAAAILMKPVIIGIYSWALKSKKPP